MKNLSLKEKIINNFNYETNIYDTDKNGYKLKVKYKNKNVWMKDDDEGETDHIKLYESQEKIKKELEKFNKLELAKKELARQAAAAAKKLADEKDRQEEIRRKEAERLQREEDERKRKEQEEFEKDRSLMPKGVRLIRKTE